MVFGSCGMDVMELGGTKEPLRKSGGETSFSLTSSLMVKFKNIRYHDSRYSLIETMLLPVQVAHFYSICWSQLAMK